jgi:uncharacterized membrane protein
MSKLKTALLLLMALFYMFAGVMHFLVPQVYVQIMPAYIPRSWHLLLVYLSGVCEFGLGALLLWPRFTRLAAWGIIALLFAVFPANLDMALNPRPLTDVPEAMRKPNPTFAWARLPFQAVFIGWAYLYTRPRSSSAAGDRRADS